LTIVFMSYLRVLFGICVALLAGCGASEQGSSSMKSRAALSVLGHDKSPVGTGFDSGQRAQLAGATTQLLKDPGLENGAPGWVATAMVIEVDADIAHGGSSYAHLAGYNDADDELYQDVAIPAGASAASFSFWYAVTSSEAHVSPGGDRMTVAVHDPATGTRLGLLAQYTNASVNDAWTASETFNLAAYAGRTVRLRFHATSDAKGVTSFVVDDLALNVTTAAPPAQGNASATYPGKRAQYTITASGGGFQIRDSATGVTSSIPAATRRLNFADASVALDTDGVPGKVYRLYQAAFDRAPDKAGLGFWIGEAERVPYSMDQLATFFMNSDEFRNRYGNPDNRGFLLQVYRNVLHREGDAAGVNFYLANLNGGGVSRSQVLAAFAESAENKDQVKASIAHGVEYVKPAPACGAGQSAVGGACVPQVRATGSLPANGAINVGTTAFIRVAFDQKMDSAAMPLRDGAITVSPALPGFQERWENQGSVWHLEVPVNWSTTAGLQLKPATQYVVTVHPNRVKAANGSTLGEPYTFSFTTSASCQAGANVSGVCAPVCTAPKVLVNGQCTMPANPSCPSGQVLQNGVCVVQPAPAPGCPAGQSMVNGVCTSPPGSACAAPQVRINGACITPAAGVSHPRVLSVTPADKASVRGWPAFGGAPLDEIKVTFDREMDWKTSQGFKFVHTASKTEYSGSGSAQGNVFTIEVQEYQMMLAGEWKLILRNAKDTKGVVMQDFESTFNVSVDFTVTPSWASDILQSTPIVIKFNVPVNPATINDKTIIMVAPNNSTSWHTVSYDAATNTAIMKPIGRWPGGTTLYAAVTSGVKNAAGQSVNDRTGSYQTMYFVERGAVSDPSPTPPPSPTPTPTPTPPPPSTGTGPTSPDKDGCYRPRRSPSCVVLTRNEIDKNGRLWTSHKNTCGARIAIRVCHKMKTGKWNCGMTGIDNNASYNWDTGGASQSMVAFTGSTKPNADFICTDRDPGWPPSPN
jgi:hypothetical protein